MFDLTIHEFGRYRHNEMLKEAELERRRIQWRRREGVTHVQQLLLQLSRLLTATGAWLQQHTVAPPSLARRRAAIS